MVGETDLRGDEKLLGPSRQAYLVALVAPQSINSLCSTLLGESHSKSELHRSGG